MKVLVVCVNMNMGGVRSSLLNFLRSVRSEGDSYEVLSLKGINDCSLFDFFKQEMITLYSKSFFYDAYYSSLGDFAKKKNIVKLIVKIFFVLIRRFLGSKKVLSLVCALSKKMGPYDLAISYDNDIWLGKGGFSGGANQYIIEKVNAIKKIAWIHAEPSYYELTHERGVNTYKKFDAIINVSFACKNLFDCIVPEYCSKSFVVYNSFDECYINLAKNSECFIRKSGMFKIITVARVVEKAKRISRIIQIGKHLISRGMKFEWYVIGDGPLLEQMRKDVLLAGLEKSIFFLGPDKNPYKYISKCDVFVLPSEQESFGMVLAESLICGVPVICSNFKAASEVVKDKENGFIVNNTIDAFVNAIEFFCKNPDCLKKENIVYANNSKAQYREILNFLEIEK